MPVTLSAFGLSADEAAELRLEIGFSESVAEIKSQTQPVFEIMHRLPDIDLRDVNLYFFAFCLTGHSGEAQISRLQMRGTHASLGYVFPMTFFRGEAAIDGDWPKRYARVAFHKLIDLSNIANFAPEATLHGFRDRCIFPDEIFPDHLSIVVAGLKNLNDAGIGIEQLKLMLLAQKITILDRYERDPNFYSSDKFSMSVSLAAVSPVIGEDIGVIFQLLRQSDTDTSEVGRFLKLYQLIEYSIEKVYAWSIKALLGMDISSWRLKKKLATITADRSRLGILAAHCLQPTVNRVAFDALAVACRELLGDLGEELEDGGSWHHLLYNVRNIVVHDQIKLIRTPNDFLPALNDALRDACFELTSTLTEPDLSTIWSLPQNEAAIEGTGTD
ncbi:hypothetical protein [Gluconacetobacter takamatsuzukensis]|uniref:Uncharacterized protein n=1 Tax=Gluconacetobacter takamatsuzukensis TaxID=1286190 RepID=A0A7W4PMS9_9PROT|nr:hypothetical protein [Gluconacetobacter takamatsuzukensis]MBB2203887.1 hypothetical protein [Gluconacetobacter takamatsuzukensis]